MVEETKKIHIEQWLIDHVDVDEKYTIPVMKGLVDGKKIKTDAVLWLDVDEKIAMTKGEIYKLGEPNNAWFNAITASGYTLKNVEIKATIH
jgi:hypothetical protein